MLTLFTAVADDVVGLEKGIGGVSLEGLVVIVLCAFMWLTSTVWHCPRLQIVVRRRQWPLRWRLPAQPQRLELVCTNA